MIVFYPFGGGLHPGYPYANGRLNLTLTSAQPTLTQPIPNSQNLAPFVDPRWIAANARYVRAKFFDVGDLDAAKQHCRHVVTLIAQEANAGLRPVQPNSYNGVRTSRTGNFEGLWRPEACDPVQVGNVKNWRVDPRWIEANARYWRAKIFDMGDLDAAKQHCQRVVTLIAQEANARLRPVQPNNYNGVRPSRTGNGEGLWRPEALHPIQLGNAKNRQLYPRWVEANARYMGAKQTNMKEDIDAALLECQRVQALIFGYVKMACLDSPASSSGCGS